MGTIEIQPNRKMKLWKFQKAIVNDQHHLKLLRRERRIIREASQA